MTEKSATQPGWQRELAVYLLHVLALFRPGYSPPTFVTMTGKAADTGTLDYWKEADVTLLIDEGRRTFDTQSTRLDRIRQTAQVVLPVGIALLVVVGTALRPIHTEKTALVRWIYYFSWSAALGLVLLAVLGSAALLVARSAFGGVLPTLLSQQKPPIAKDLARAYAEQMTAGENSLNTKLTLQWWSVTFLTAGGLVYVILWFLLNL